MTIKTRLDVREVYMTVTKENIKDFTKKYAQICRKNDTVEKELFTSSLVFIVKYTTEVY